MSSILFVEVAGKHEDTLALLLSEIQLGFVFVESPTLALQLLLESWRVMRDGCVADSLRASCSGGLYCPFSAEEARTRAAASPIGLACPDPPDEEGFVKENAGRYVLSTEVSEVRHAAGLRNSPVPARHYFGPRAECRFRVRVADVAWLGHLEAGVCWDTTAYPYERG